MVLQECTRRADPDVFGIGVRLGFYFQILSTLLMSTTDCGSAVAVAQLVYAFALEVNALSKLGSGTVDVEFYAIMSLCGLLTSPIISITSRSMVRHARITFKQPPQEQPSNADVRISKIALSWNGAILLGCSVVQLIATISTTWFLFKGYKVIARDLGCPPMRMSLLFVAVRLNRDAFRHFLQAMGLISQIVSVVFVVMGLMGVRIWCCPVQDRPEDVEGIDDQDIHEHTLMNAAIGFFMLVVMVWHIEHTITSNKTMRGSHKLAGIGQVIPFVMALLSVLQAVVFVARQHVA
jgi:hypothetical protein